MSVWFGQMAPRDQGCSFVHPGPASGHCESNHAAQLLNKRATKLVEVPKQRSWGWSPVYAHTQKYKYSCHPDLLIVLLKDERTERGDFLLMNLLIFLTCPQLPQAPWTAVTPLLPQAILLCICLEHKCQNKHARYRGVSHTITEPILTDDLCLWSNVYGKQRYSSHL